MKRITAIVVICTCACISGAAAEVAASPERLFSLAAGFDSQFNVPGKGMGSSSDAETILGIGVRPLGVSSEPYSLGIYGGIGWPALYAESFEQDPFYYEVGVWNRFADNHQRGFRSPSNSPLVSATTSRHSTGRCRRRRNNAGGAVVTLAARPASC